MKINCSELDNLLFEGDVFSMQQAAAHAQSCADCAEKLADWNDITATAKTMQTTWQSDMLLPRIERSIRTEKRRSLAHVWQIAAGFMFVAMLATAVWFAHRRAQQNDFDTTILQVAAVDEVERAERAHIEAIQRLQDVADPKLENASSPLMVSYKEKLMMLDAAIAECEAGIQHNRQNAHLRKQLLAIYSEKQRTLQDVVREGTHAN